MTTSQHLLAGALATLLCTATVRADPAADPTPDPEAKPHAEIVAGAVVAVMGLAVQGEDGKEIGRIVDVLVDAQGRPQAAIVDVGGFLGVGNRRVAADWQALRFKLGKAPPAAALQVPTEQVKAAPAYDPAKPVEAIGSPTPETKPQ